MGSEKSAPPGIVARFGSADEASRRVAGVAAAARAARDLAVPEGGRIWIAVPGGMLGAHAIDDLERLCGEGGFAVVDSAALTDLVARAGASSAIVIDAPRLDAGAILRATGKAGDGLVSRWINRPISRAISAQLLRLEGVRPVHATIAAALAGVGMFCALVFGGASGLMAGALLFQFASILDGVDGEIARATFRSSAAGARLDSIVDMATNLLFVLGLVANLALAGRTSAALAGSAGLLVFAAGLAAISWRTARGSAAFVVDLVKHDSRRRFGGRVTAAFVAAAIAVSSRDFFALFFALLILCGLAELVAYVFTAAAAIWILYVIAAVSARDEAQLSKGSA